MKPWIPCEFCGELGLRIPCPSDVPVAVSADSPLDAPALQTGTACEKHRRLVELRLRERYAPRRAAHAEGRP